MCLEKIRFSITRLKLGTSQLARGPKPVTWKDKILDYEIETIYAVDADVAWYPLEKIRFSITRLKPVCMGPLQPWR